MALTAREWLLLPKDEQEKRRHELSSHECFLLRTELEYIRLTEEEKNNMSPEKRYEFLHPKTYAAEERQELARQRREIFKKLSEETEEKRK